LFLLQEIKGLPGVKNLFTKRLSLELFQNFFIENFIYPRLSSLSCSRGRSFLYRFFSGAELLHSSPRK